LQLDVILWALWYSLIGLGFLGFHRRYGHACPSPIALLALISAALQAVMEPVYALPLPPQHILNLVIYDILGKATTLAIVGYALMQAREQSKNRLLMGVTGIGLIVGGVAVASVFPLVSLITSVSSLLAFVLFIQEYRVHWQTSLRKDRPSAV
jgi:hypothetical protein